jgi:glycosyltransferase involved in cell wall biosynthesis
MASHLRPVKRPFLAVEAAMWLPAQSGIQILHYGAEDEPGFADQARQFMKEVPRYHWLGESDRAGTLEALAGAHLALNTSDVEGGANSICEAIQVGVPVVASDIPANVGMLGKGYPGLFSAGDARALAGVLARAESERQFMSQLVSATVERAPIFTPEREVEAWRQAILELKS